VTSGSFNPSYTSARPELLALIPAACTRVLDVGCATGESGAALKAARPAVHVTGIELDPLMAAVARPKLDRVVVCDAEKIFEARDALEAGTYDCIVCGDVLEHLADPWRVLRELVDLGTEGAFIVASVPNVAHLSTFGSLLAGRWPYRERGIHDRSHLRFFALENVRALFAQAGLEIVRLERKYRLIEHPHPLNRLARRLALPGFRNLLTFQFLVLARAGSDAVRPPASRARTP
jgi:2-polyprenyl-3-methyl-5-hydroxy-6-metoxy-1,4-benzoquinol methylase